MSRIGKKPIILPTGVTVTLTGDELVVQGGKGELKRAWPKAVKLTVEDKQVSVGLVGEQDNSMLWGLYRALVQNMIKGVSEGFSKNLILQGVGYRATVKGDELELNLGFSHPINFKAPAGISFQVEKNKLTVSGMDKASVGQTAALIRQYRLPEPYKGSGIRYEDEIIIRKAGKKAATAA